LIVLRDESGEPEAVLRGPLEAEFARQIRAMRGGLRVDDRLRPADVRALAEGWKAPHAIATSVVERRRLDKRAR
jgi:hypothetical protein